jgi:hypothetical protein
MNKILLLASIFLTISAETHASVFKSFDQDATCDLYRVVQAENNKVVKPGFGETVITDKEAYGLSFLDMEVDFSNHQVLIQPTINIVLGFNRPLIKTKAIIEETNPEFNFLINQLNRKIFLFEKICLRENIVIYAKMFETKAEIKK